MTVLCIIGLIGTILFFVYMNKYNEKEKELHVKIKELNAEKENSKQIKEAAEEESKKYSRIVDSLQKLLATKKPFSAVAQMYADAHTIILGEKTGFTNLWREDLQKIKKYKELEYQYEALVNTYFRDVSSQLKDEESLCEFLKTMTTEQYIKYVYNRINQCERETQIATYNYKLLQNKAPFRAVAKLIAEIDSKVFDSAADYLDYKPYPAHPLANEVRTEMKQKYIMYRSLYEDMQAKYDYLFQIYPELEEYLDDPDEQSLLDLEDDSESLKDIQQQTDKVVKYISKEEWNSLSEAERYQHALDNYNNNSNPKSNATIGLEYEMAVDYWLREEHKLKTYPFGAINGLHDLGRDIIAQKVTNGKTYTYIIQCKLRGKKRDSDEYKQIHENVVCQIYGSSLVYRMQHQDEIVIPAICTNVELSKTAKEFAEQLHVKIISTPRQWREWEYANYPQIKCNINNTTGEKIYHLPFDQQYWHTLIEPNTEECFVFTIQEAIDKGFRRAKRYNPYT